VSFGRTIRRRREAVGLTLEQLAERSGLSPNYVGTVENGRRDPSLSTVVALAKGLRVPPGELLGPVQELSSEAYDVGRQFDAAPEDVQDLVVRLLRVAARRRR
jgi:transcriptional regulator with XRE-family HTH domain